MSDRVVLEIVVDAEAEVSPAPDHAAECVALHPNQPCPGYPHADKDDQS